MKILFVGAGAIGSYLGAFLTRAGHDVTLVDPWAEQVETIRQKGISVTGPHEPFEARGVGDLAVLDGHVEVRAHQHALAGDVEGVRSLELIEVHDAKLI